MPLCSSSVSECSFQLSRPFFLFFVKTTLHDDAAQRSRKSRERAAKKAKEYVGIHPRPARERLEASKLLETGRGDWRLGVQYSTVQYNVKNVTEEGRREGKGRGGPGSVFY